MSAETWFGVLDLAEEYGWNPMGTLLPDWLCEAKALFAGQEVVDYHLWRGNYTEGVGGLVSLEDALNFNDALERAFLEREPVCLPQVMDGFAASLPGSKTRLRPGVGALMAVLSLSQDGAFWIEKYTKPD